MRGFLHFLRDESGSNVVEYALVGSIVTIIAITAMMAMGLQVDAFLSGVLPYL